MRFGLKRLCPSWFLQVEVRAGVAEWLRRRTRDPMGETPPGFESQPRRSLSLVEYGVERSGHPMHGHVNRDGGWFESQPRRSLSLRRFAVAPNLGSRIRRIIGDRGSPVSVTHRELRSRARKRSLRCQPGWRLGPWRSLDSASGFGPEGRGFESPRAHILPWVLPLPSKFVVDFY